MRFPLLGVQAGQINGLVLRIKALVRSKACPEFGNYLQLSVVGSAQFWRVSHAIEMADCTPCARKSLGCHIQRGSNSTPAGRKPIFRYFYKGRIGIAQQAFDGWFDVLRLDLVKQRKVRKVEEWICHDVKLWAMTRKSKGTCPAKPGAVLKNQSCERFLRLLSCGFFARLTVPPGVRR